MPYTKVVVPTGVEPILMFVRRTMPDEFTETVSGINPLPGLSEVKVAPVTAEVNAEAPAVETRELPPAMSVVPKAAPAPKAKRAELH